MWGKVSCLRKQHDGRDWASNHQPSDLKSKALTTTPLRPYQFKNHAREIYIFGDCLYYGLSDDLFG